ncbi:glutathione S-transferase family protein, partial [Rhizobium johnstonii]|uniref:glutathione S-transferase family protein n=1 Tax=Rhizobium johnstonii TaxID=3019933 RepID=UPI003F9BD0C8
TYVDLSLFQVIEGLNYSFPKAMTKRKAEYPGLLALSLCFYAIPGKTASRFAGNCS